MQAARLLQEILAAESDDPFRDVNIATQVHRRQHGCGAYTYDKGPMLVALVRKLAPTSVLELGTALGYTALCLSEAGQGMQLTTIERDMDHVRIARQNIQAAGREDQINVQHGSFEVILPRISGHQDLIFFDGFAADETIYNHILRLSRKDSVLVSANMALPGDHAYGDALADKKVWDTVFVDEADETALSIRQ